MSTEIEIGTITHYFGHLNVAAIKLTASLAVGDTLRIRGHTSDLTVTVDSIQIEHKSVQKAAQGDNVGITVPGHVREHDKVYKVAP
ncbi:MAG TPA: translation elongation factor-like protein [Kiritimatiellia bacterium]|nr:translation elongation factor-like protein [Kiritimatiellia bacterium]HRZ12110.1 translation elongation factor-like protein [Kiritimatiellia bacterium]HSA18132.1 translation elongation factor-like protein [Kiritimatiellia bacterium]